MSDVIATNKKAFRDYFLDETWEAGLELAGPEVKSVREGKVNFTDAFARVEKGEVLLYNLNIQPYGRASHMNVAPDRVRKLLLHKKEILRMGDKCREGNRALMPTRLYLNARGLVKLQIALARGKKMYDKRDVIRKRRIDRQIKRDIRNRSRG